MTSLDLPVGDQVALQRRVVELETQLSELTARLEAKSAGLEACPANPLRPQISLPAELRELELRTVLDSVPSFIAICNLDGSFIYLNGAHSLETAQYLQGKRFIDVVHPDYQDRAWQAFQKAIETKSSQYLEHRVFAASGETMWVEATYNPILSTERVLFVTIQAAQIDDRIRQEQLLRDSNGWLRQAYDVAEMGSWQNDLATDIMQLDTRAQQHYGAEQPALSTSLLISRVPEADRERVAAAIARSRQPDADRRSSIEHRVIHPDGSVHWLAIDVNMEFEGEGANRRAVRAFGTSRDITNRKEIEQALQESEARYRSLVESTDALIALVDADGTIHYVNRGLTPAMVTSSMNPIGRKVQHTFRLENIQQQLGEIRDVIARNEGKVIESHIEVDGQEFWRRVSLQPVRDALGHATMALAHITDVTSYKELERSLRRRIDLEQMISAASTRFINLPAGKAGPAIESMLSAIGEFIGAEHGTVFLLSEDGELVNCRYEWCGPGIRAELADLQNIPLATMPTLANELKYNRIYHIPLVQDMPDGIGKTALLANHTLSYTVVPLYAQNSCLGGLAFRATQVPRTYSDYELAPLRLIAEILTSAFERWRADAALQELNHTLEHRVAERAADIFDLYNRAPCGYHSLDANGNYVHVNDTELHWLGYTREEMLGHNFQEFLTLESKATFERNFPVFKAHGAVQDIEFEMVRRDGTPMPVSLSATLIRDDAGQPVATRSTVFDMTERQRAERRLRESEQRLNYLLGETPALIFTMQVADLEHFNVAYCSQSVQKMLGYEVNEIVNPSVPNLERIHPDDIGHISGSVTSLLEIGEVVVDFRFRHIDGYYRWLSCGMRLIQDVQGQPKEIIGYAVDITTQKEAEAALRASEARWRSMVQCAPALIAVVDRNGHITSVNRSAWAFGGLVPADLVGSSVYAFAKQFAIDEDTVQRALDEVLQTGRSVDFASSLQMRDGDLGYMKCFLGPVQIGNTIDSIVLIGLDVTDLKRVEAELQAQRDFARHVMDTIGQGLLVADNAGRIEYINPYLERLLGRPMDAVLGSVVSDFVPTTERQVIETQRMHRLAGATDQYEMRIAGADGVTRTMLVTAAPRRTHGVVTGVIAIMTDLTETKQVEAQLRQSRDNLSAANFALERAARMKDEFLASMSHELRTPLTAILGLSEGLLENVLGPLTTKQQEAIGTIESSGRHLLHLINEILDLSKIEAGVMNLDMGPVPINDVCNTSLTFIKEMAAKKRIKTFLTVDSSVEFIQADERRLKQILVNLLSNAVKFTLNNGRVGLEVTGDTELGVAHFTVWDTGIGIAQKDIERLFQPFVQLDSALSRQYSGTGLGLSLVARMTELHGGSVSVESEMGVGSRFTVSMPWTETSSDMQLADLQNANDADIYFPFQTISQTQTTSPVLDASSAPLILLAEDNEANIHTLSSYLEAKGYPLIVARNGGEALKLARSEHPALILMDVQMPVMDGYEATCQIRQDVDSIVANVPIIAVTALAVPGDRNRLLLAGANEYLTKPVNLKSLVGLIEEMLHKK